MNTKIFDEFNNNDIADEYLMNFGDVKFSQRMLKEHLSQNTEFASRKLEEIDTQVEFLYQRYLKSGYQLLDLACGPGLYTSRFARKGINATGYDISPAAIDYAKKHSGSDEIYHKMNLNDFQCNGQFDLVLMLFGIANNLSNLKTVLKKVRKTLKVNGSLVVELMNVSFMEALAQGSGTWEYFEDGGLLSDKPHYKLCKRIWYAEEKRLVDRNMIIDHDSQVSLFDGIFWGYDIDDFNKLLNECGFSSLRIICEQLSKGELTQHFFMLETSLK